MTKEVFNKLEAKQAELRTEKERLEKLVKEFQVRAALDDKYKRTLNDYQAKLKDVADRLKKADEEVFNGRMTLLVAERQAEREAANQKMAADKKAELEQEAELGYKYYFANYYRSLVGKPQYSFK